MSEQDRKNHWDQVYQTKSPDQVSWTQDVPQTSLDLIHSLSLPKTASIIDIGGGDSKLVDHLLSAGYTNVSVLDISEAAVNKAKARLGENVAKVKWIVADVTEFRPQANYDLWHDRAAFHFLTTGEQIAKYVALTKTAISGYLVIGTFSKEGPQKCSGLDIRQYSPEDLQQVFSDGFTLLGCINIDHHTPFGTLQNFTFCSFKKHS